ncbi:hypothetical protein ABPG72_013471 [Tetrahymena utriculariae]
MSQINPSNNIKPLLQPTVIQSIVRLAIDQKAINLASGFPDWDTPQFVTRSIANASSNGENQYCLPGGHPILRQQIAETYSKSLGIEINPEKNVFVGQGASGVIFDIYTALLNPGDEVIIFDPHYEFLSKEAKLVGAVVRHCSLQQPRDLENGIWTINFEQFKSVFNQRTKIVLINTPHNPTGKIFTKEELNEISQIIQMYPSVVVIADEVYEHLTFDNKSLNRVCQTPGLTDRTISVYSMGKTFSCTGWRVGFAIGPEELIKYAIAAHSYTCYSINRPAQVGIANCLRLAENPYEGFQNYYSYFRNIFENNRNKLIQNFSSLQSLDLKLNKPEGGYFLIGSFEKFATKIPLRYFYKDYENVIDGDQEIGIQYEKLENPEVSLDVAFSTYMAVEKKVAVIPLSSFYGQATNDFKNFQGKYLFRIALCRKEKSYEDAINRLKQLS